MNPGPEAAAPKAAAAATTPAAAATAAPAAAIAPNAARFAPLAEQVARRWERFGSSEDEFFAHHLGMVTEEVRADYARMRLPWQGFLRQRQGIMHGGVIASLVDTCVVPAIAAHYERRPRMATVNLAVQYLRPVRDSDLVAEGWVEHRGRSVVFCRAEVRSVAPSGAVELVATANLLFRVSPRPATAPPAAAAAPDDTAGATPDDTAAASATTPAAAAAPVTAIGAPAAVPAPADDTAAAATPTPASPTDLDGRPAPG